MQATNSSNGKLVAARVVRAETAKTRVIGLMGRRSMEPGEALWIVPCSNIHTFFMRFPIDVLFLDEQLSVLRVIDRLRPWRVSPWVWKAHSVLELEGGALDGAVKPGDRLEFR